MVQKIEKRKNSSIKTAGFILIIVLSILLFVSKTIYTYRLPVVTATKPFNGKLNKIEKSKGFASIEKMLNLYTEVSGKVEDVCVKDGDIVKKGQEILKMSFDKDEVQQSLKELEVDESKIFNEISTTNIKLESNKKYLEFLQNEKYIDDTVSDYDLKQINKEIEIAEEDLKDKELLYSLDAIAKVEYENAKNLLESLKVKKEYLDKNYEETLLKIQETQESKEKARQKQIEDYKVENELLKNKIEENQLNMSALQIQKEILEKKLKKFDENEIIYAKEDGKLLDFNIKNGEKLEEHHFIGSIGIGDIYEIECSLSVNNDFIVVGDKCKLKNANNSLDGTVTNIKLYQTQKIVKVLVESQNITHGETFDATFEKESKESYILVSNGAINVDSEGYFLYQIKRREGIIGKEFYTQKIRVYIGDNDEHNTAIIKGISFFEPISLYSNKFFTEGQTIYLNNVGDFF